MLLIATQRDSEVFDLPLISQSAEHNQETPPMGYERRYEMVEGRQGDTLAETTALVSITYIPFLLLELCDLCIFNVQFAVGVSCTLEALQMLASNTLAEDTCDTYMGYRVEQRPQGSRVVCSPSSAPNPGHFFVHLR
jgi:hypothetical protein